jgi:type IV secretion system protein VirD4
MGELRLGTEHEVGDVQNLALLIVDPDGKGLRAGDHFQKTAYSLLVGCILHLCYKGQVEGTPATFGALDHMLADSSRPIQDLWTEMLTYGHINGANHPVVSASARDMLDRPPNEAGSVLSTAKTFLDLYRRSDRRQEHEPVRFSDPGPDALHGSCQPVHHHAAE